MVEILKQPQFKPLGVVDQIAIIFAAANGHLDDVAIADVRRYEDGLLAYLHDSHGPFFEAMKAKPTLDDGNDAELDRICAEFTRAFLEGDAPDPR
jgi:F-type H+-transporting ATPase subunit alpha